MKRIKKALVPLSLAFAVSLAAGCSSESTSDDLYKPDESKAAESGSDFSDLHSFTASAFDETQYDQEIFKEADLTVINIWSIGCQPCIDEMPELAEFERSLPDNVKLITYCVDGSADYDTMNRILDDAGYTGINFVTGSGDLSVLRNEVMYVPTTIFVDSEGSILGDAIIGNTGHLTSSYTAAINERLSDMGKQEI